MTTDRDERRGDRSRGPRADRDARSGRPEPRGDARPPRRGGPSKRAGATAPDREPAAPAVEMRQGKPRVAPSRNLRPRQRPAHPDARPEARDATLAGAPVEPMRIAKAMARAGLCSRRDAERWIADGRVAVNGHVIRSPALDVAPTDRVLVDGQPLPGVEPPKLWRYHKPRGLVTTHRDPEGRETVFDKLPPALGRVISVGRLDVTSEGLLLVTNDGALARHLELPSTGWLRRYRVRAHGRISAAALEKLKDGIEVEGVRYGPIEATLDKEQGANVWLTLGLREGKNREVRNVLAALGLEVNRLIRISYGPFQLLDLPPGEVEIVRRRVLLDQLGPLLARELGLMEQVDADRDRRNTARDAARDPARSAARDSAPGSARDSAQGAARDPAKGSARAPAARPRKPKPGDDTP
jgi:23S rRNA pseudouridine2605 synthase